MSDQDHDVNINLDGLHDKITNLHGMQKYTAIGGGLLILVILFFALVGGYMMYGQIEDSRELAKQLAATQEKIGQRLENIEKQSEEQKKLYDKLSDLQRDMAKIQADYAVLRATVNKPLPQPQQDQFFVSRGFVPSYYQADGGRLFGSDATVKLQTTIVDGEECKEVVAKQDEQITTQTGLIDSYKKQVGEYVQLDGLRQEEFKIVNTELKKTQKELRRERIKKWVWTCIGVSVAGYGGYQAGKH